VLIAAVVLAAGAAVILGQVYQLLDYAHRARGHQDEVRQALNDAALLGLSDPDSLSRTLEQDSLLLNNDRAEPVARVENHPFEGVAVPVSVGMAPFQIFTVPVDGRHALALIGRGLSPRSDR
jgi:hypothetical protein